MEWAEIVADSWKSHLSHIWCQAQQYIAQQAQSHWAEVWRMSSTTRAGLLRSTDTCQERCQNCNFWRSHCDTPSAQAVCLHQIITKSSLLFKTKCVIIQTSRLKMLQSLAIPKKLYLPKQHLFSIQSDMYLLTYLPHTTSTKTLDAFQYLFCTSNNSRMERKAVLLLKAISGIGDFLSSTERQQWCTYHL